MSSTATRGLAALLAAVAGACAAAAPAHATFPGADGRIAAAANPLRICGYVYLCGVVRSQVVTVEPDGSARTDLPKQAGSLAGPGFSPDGTRIVATKPTSPSVPGNSEGEPPVRRRRIVTGAATGPVTSPVRTRDVGTTSVPLTLAASASWTPDGRLLITEPGRVAIRDGLLRPLRTIVEAGDDTSLGDAVMSPDGRTIAFTVDGGEIWLVGADGSRPRRFKASGSHPDWSPDGSRLVYDQPYTTANLTIAHVADGKETNVPVTGSNPVWSPTGTRLAYVAGDEVHVADVDGGNDRVVLRFPTIGEGLGPVLRTVVDGVSWQARP